MVAKANAVPIHVRIQQQIVEKQQRQYTRRMASALCATYQIPVGDQLVALLTTSPKARTNEEAVAAWIDSQLLDPDLAISTAVLPILTDLLGKKLHSISEGPSC
ncbi:hypothetical protein [Nevskia ramosa]|uniref:hypothetical protein n=1 Tax=Nevskia ramosa TaxID=64002 RepID=UPI003D0EC13A